MQKIVFCLYCAVEQVTVQVNALGTENRFDDGECPMCGRKFAGRVLDQMEEGTTSVSKIELEKKTVRIGSHGSIMKPIR
jgi:hypothetical protein